MSSMESGGTEKASHFRSEMTEFEITNAAELEAHINMNAAAAKANFDKYYRERMETLTKTWVQDRRNLDVEVPVSSTCFSIDVSTPKFDFSTIGERFKAKCLEQRTESAGTPLRLKLRGVDYTNVEKLCRALDSTDLESLDLSDNKMESDDCAALAGLITQHRGLRCLDLSGNKIGNEGVVALSTGLATSGVTDLDLSSNELGKPAAAALSSLLGMPTNAIQRLRLAANKIGIYGAEALSAGVKASKLRALGLQNNGIGNDGAAFLLTVFQEPSPNKTLVQISLESNKVDSDVLGRISAGCQQNEYRQQRESVEAAEAIERGLWDPEFLDSVALMERWKAVSLAEIEKKAKPAPKVAKAPNQPMLAKAKVPMSSPAKKSAPGKSPQRCGPKAPASSAQVAKAATSSAKAGKSVSPKRK